MPSIGRLLLTTQLSLMMLEDSLKKWIVLRRLTLCKDMAQACSLVSTEGFDVFRHSSSHRLLLNPKARIVALLHLPIRENESVVLHSPFPGHSTGSVATAHRIRYL